MLMDNSNDNVVNTIEKVLKLFRVERFFYVTVTIISFIALVSLLTYLMVSDFEKNIYFSLGLFGPTGLITFSCGRILKMWSDVIGLLGIHMTHTSK